MMCDNLGINVSASFNKPEVSVGGVSVSSGHDSGWDSLSLSGAGFYLYLPCSSLIPGHNLEPSVVTSVSVIVTNNGFIRWLMQGQITLERGLHPC